MEPAAAQAGGMLNLEKELICFICTELLYQPLTLIDCLHTFCGSCLKSWFQLQHHKACSSHHTSSSTNPYTCPTCRATVKTARPNAMVNTWLELYLTANPSRAPTQDEKDEKSGNYKPGDDILPKVVRHGRRGGRHRRTEGERLLEEAQSRSRREAQNAVEPRQDLLQPMQNVTSEQSRSRERDQERDERRARRREAERQRRQRIQAAEQETLEGTDEGHDEEYEHQQPPLPPISSPRHPDAVEERQRRQRVMHQSSLVSLISSSEGGTGSSIFDSLDENALRDLIMAEGLYDGINVDNLTEAEQDMIADRVAEAFRQWQHGQLDNGNQRTAPAPVQITAGNFNSLRPDNDNGRRPRNRSASNQRRSDTHPPPGSTNRVTIRPQSSRTTPSEMSTSSAVLPPSTTISQTRRRYSNQNQSSVTTRTRSRQSSPRPNANRAEQHSAMETSTTSAAVEASNTELAHRPGPVTRSNTEPRPTEPLELPDDPVSSATYATTTTSPQATPANPPNGDPTNGSPLTSPRSSGLQLSASRPRTARSASRTLSQSGMQALTLFEEPSISCFRCYRNDIQYEVHKYCESCDLSLCLSCYRKGKGCKYWFGFGDAAMMRFNQQHADRRDSEQVPLPHELVGRSLRTPHRSLVVGTKLAKDGETTLPTRTMSDPKTRMRQGYFCDRCGAFANSTFYSCITCNSGEWGFCKDCVSTHHCCTHYLRPITQQNAYSSTNRQGEGSTSSPVLTPSETHGNSLAPALFGHSQPTSAASTISNMAGPRPGFAYLHIRTNCDQCGILIEPTFLHYHCPFHVGTDANGVNAKGNYDICTQCYNSLVKNNRIKLDDGPPGWRKCPLGHRMIIVVFMVDADGGCWRIVNNDLVGGRHFSDEDIKVWMELKSKERVGNIPAEAVDLAEFAAKVRKPWQWQKDVSTGQRTTQSPNGFTSSLITSPTGQPPWYKFPPDGGLGSRALARYLCQPEDGEAGENMLRFPYNAEIRELEQISSDFWHGVYAGDSGYVPATYLRSMDGHKLL